MKKIGILLIALITLTSCGSSKKVSCVKSPEPNMRLTAQVLQQNGITPTELHGLYVSISKSITFFFDNGSLEKEEEVQGGIYFQRNIISGEKLNIPQTVPFVCDGKPMTSPNGRIVSSSFLAEIISVEMGPQNIAQRYWVSFEGIAHGGSVTVTVPFVLVSSGEYQIETFDGRTAGELQQKAYQESGFSLDPNNGYVWVRQGGANYILVQDMSGRDVYVSTADLSLKLDKFYLHRSNENQSTTGQGVSKTIGGRR